MMKKILCAMILVSLCFALSACGKKEPNTMVIETASETAKETVQETKAAETDGNVEIVGLSGIRPEIKEGIDNYEKLIDDYVAAMKKYQADPTNPDTLNALMEFAEKYSDVETFLTDFDRTGITVEEANYLDEVTQRCTEKMQKLGQ